MPTKKKPTAKKTSATTKKPTTKKKPASRGGFSAEERAAMRERARELRSASRKASPEDGDREVKAKIATMAKADRDLAGRVHAIVRSVAPDLVPRLWYGMPAYARDGKVVCFFQDAGKFKARYATLGFSDQARLDDGDMWAASFALTAITPAIEQRIRALVTRAAG